MGSDIKLPAEPGSPRRRGDSMLSFKGVVGWAGWLVAIVLYAQQQSSSVSSIKAAEMMKENQEETIQRMRGLLKAQHQEAQTLDQKSGTGNAKLMKEQQEETIKKIDSLLKSQQKDTLVQLSEQLKAKDGNNNAATKQDVEQLSKLVKEQSGSSNVATKEDVEELKKLLLSSSSAVAKKDVSTSTTSKKLATTTTSTSKKLPISTNPMMKRALLNSPPIPPTAGTLKPTKDMTPFEAIKPTLDKRKTDGEDYDILHNYFWGQENGIVMELGALDGKQMSVSRPFLPLNWFRLLVEANPSHALNGPKNSPDAAFVHAAICDEKQGVVHYLRKKGAGPVNGIAEFMSDGFYSQFHGDVFKASDRGKDYTKVANWTKWSQEPGRSTIVDEVPCLGLNTIFNSLGIEKINFFMLDVEGAELNILESLDFSTIQFDALIVETEPNSPKYRPEGYAQKVIGFLEGKGYIFDKNVGRNSWFHHPSFVPFKDPEIE